MSMKTCIKIHPDDLVAVALTALAAGTRVRLEGQSVTLLEDIPRGHKFALLPIPAGTAVIKYGAPIGVAAADIPEGGWVHTHNIKTCLKDAPDYTYEPCTAPLVPADDCLFQGYRRENGRAAVRNEIWIIPTVGCVNSVAAAVERRAQSLKKGTVDGIYAFPHPCGCSRMGDDQENTKRILAGLINHPNAGGVLVLGLGCESSSIEVLKPYIGQWNEKRVKFLVCQESDDETEDALALIEELADYAGSFRREPISCGELVVGMMCCGCDGLSGITASPAAGAFSDMLLSMGGTTILAEAPDMLGAETQLMNRCENERVFSDTVAMTNSFRDYLAGHGRAVFEALSPGDMKGGISTPEDRALGCLQKSGSAPVAGVLSCGETVRRRGLHLLSAPGDTPAASTALAASGAHIVLLATGRGSPLASPVPTVKISGGTSPAAKKQNWTDFSCDTPTEDSAAEELGRGLFDFVLGVASGEQVKAEKAGFHEMAVFRPSDIL